MKKLLYILSGVLLFSCNDDIVEGPAMGFYPTSVQEALEEDGVQYQVTLTATGELNSGGVIQIEFDNYEFIETVPAHEDGVFQINVSANGSADFTVEALDDDIQGGYTATFRITDTGGSITGIANSKFSFVVEDDDVINSFFEDFESDGFDDWEVFTTSGNEWETREFSGNTYADVSNFNASSITEGWLVSPEIDFSANENEILTFQTQTRFNDQEETFTAYIVTGYTQGTDPGLATLTELTFSRDPHEGAGFGDFTDSGEIDLGTFTGTGRLAFYYGASSSADGSGWSVDNIAISSFSPSNSDGLPNVDTGGSGGGDGSGGSGTFFSESFESGTGTFSAFSVTGSQEWSNNSNGNTGNGVRMSGFSDGAQDNEDWLISPSLNLSSSSSATLEFFTDGRYDEVDIEVLVSTDYSGSGDPNSATWTDLGATIDTDFDTWDTWTSSGSVSLNSYLTSSTYVAFKYVSSPSLGAATWTIDDFNIDAN